MTEKELARVHYRLEKWYLKDQINNAKETIKLLIQAQKEGLGNVIKQLNIKNKKKGLEIFESRYLQDYQGKEANTNLKECIKKEKERIIRLKHYKWR